MLITAAAMHKKTQCRAVHESGGTHDCGRWMIECLWRVLKSLKLPKRLQQGCIRKRGQRAKKSTGSFAGSRIACSLVHIPGTSPLIAKRGRGTFGQNWSLQPGCPRTGRVQLSLSSKSGSRDLFLQPSKPTRTNRPQVKNLRSASSRTGAVQRACCCAV